MFNKWSLWCMCNLREKIIYHVKTLYIINMILIILIVKLFINLPKKPKHFKGNSMIEHDIKILI